MGKDDVKGVLILVVMDDEFIEISQVGMDQDIDVLILVVMDDEFIANFDQIDQSMIEES